MQKKGRIACYLDSLIEILYFPFSLILRDLLLRKARGAELLDNNSIEYILMELAKLRAAKVGGKWILTEISKKQMTNSEKLNTSIPVEANMVVKKGGV
jgi:hypothetical protein